MKRAVFLDRDGVINSYFYNSEFGTIDSPGNPEEFVLCDGVGEALELLRTDFRLIVVSNQPGIAKGRFSPALLEATTQKMKRECGNLLDAVYYCLHHPHALLLEYRQICECRKPKPGLLIQAAQDWNIDLAASFMIGDGIVDVQAGKAAGASTIFLGTRKCHLCREFEQLDAVPDYIAGDLKAAAELVLSISESKPKIGANAPCC